MSLNRRMVKQTVVCPHDRILFSSYSQLLIQGNNPEESLQNYAVSIKPMLKGHTCVILFVEHSLKDKTVEKKKDFHCWELRVGEGGGYGHKNTNWGMLLVPKVVFILSTLAPRSWLSYYIALS